MWRRQGRLEFRQRADFPTTHRRGQVGKGLFQGLASLEKLFQFREATGSKWCVIAVRSSGNSPIVSPITSMWRSRVSLSG